MELLPRHEDRMPPGTSAPLVRVINGRLVERAGGGPPTAVRPGWFTRRDGWGHTWPCGCRAGLNPYEVDVGVDRAVIGHKPKGFDSKAVESSRWTRGPRHCRGGCQPPLHSAASIAECPT